MTTIDTQPASAAPSGSRLVGSGFVGSVADWVTTTDHKRIGRLFLAISTLAFLEAVVVAALLAVERIDIDSTMLDMGSLTQLFSLYRFEFTYLVLAPAAVGVALAIVPLQVGARSLVFPRLALAGFWTWFIGADLAIYALLRNGGPGGGNARFVDLFTLAMALVMAGLIAAAGSVAATVLTNRTPGMTLRRVPFFSWASLVMSTTLLVTLPVAIGNLLVVYTAHKYPSPSPLSGNRAVEQWVGFAFTQPTTLLFLLPALGLLADTSATALRARLRPRGAIFGAIALAGTAMFAAAMQAPVVLDANFLDHSFVDMVNDFLPYALVHLLPLLGFTGAVLLTAGALARRPRVQAPMVFGLFASLLALLAAAASALNHIGDAQLVGTVFEEGTWLITVYAGVLAALGGVTYWGAKWWGRSLSTATTLPLALLGSLGAVLAGVPLMIAGFTDQPGAIFPLVESGNDAVVNFPDVDGPTELWNLASAAGHALMFLTVAAFVALAVRTFVRGEAAGDDPWDGGTLEWATTSPAPADNFAELHIVRSAEPLLDLKPNRSDA